MLKTFLIGAGVLVEARVHFAALLDSPFLAVRAQIRQQIKLKEKSYAIC
jgi:hypothetical protein